MDRLILMRHGKAETSGPGGDDFGRRLADRGVRESAAMARLLAERGFVPDVALVSAARRTRETWAAARAAFPSAEARFERGLYLAEAAAIWSTVSLEAVATVMAVGHNPGIHDLALTLLEAAGSPAAAQAHQGFPTATVAVFAFDAGGHPTCEGLFVPPKS